MNRSVCTTHTHTHTRVYKRCTHESSVARVERRLPRERELLLSLKGDWTSFNDRRGRSKFTRSYSLSLSLSRGSIAELFSSMKELTRDRIRVRTNTPARFIGHFGWSMMFHLSFFFFLLHSVGGSPRRMDLFYRIFNGIEIFFKYNNLFWIYFIIVNILLN